jgi:glucosyl-3-phosphoglycerate synthase
MTDFYQDGLVAAFQNLSRRPTEEIEAEVAEFVKARPVTLVLPALYREFRSGAMGGIVKQLREATCVKRIVVSLDRATREEFQDARKVLSRLPQEVSVLWNDGPNMGKVYSLLDEQGLLSVKEGKGRGVWAAMGYTIAMDDTVVIATHDCDIVNYDRGMVARLIYPVVHPGLYYEFSKGYYARVTDRLYGRVTRLFYWPLARALLRIIGYTPYLRYLNAFRYPLSGEFAMSSDLFRVIRFPGGWGLEVGILSEVFMNTALSRIAQAEITETYEHKHQPMRSSKGSGGLFNMCVDITTTLLRNISQMGHVFPGRFYKTLKITYLREAYDAIEKYEALALFNGLGYDRHREITSTENFADALDTGMGEFDLHPMGTPYLPSWARVASAIPDFLGFYRETVARDNPG